MRRCFTLIFFLLIHRTEVSALPSFKESISNEYSKEQYNRLFERLYNANHYETVKPSQNPRIPKIIHQIWVGGPLPKQFEIYVNSIKRCHPDWEYRLWTDSDVEGFKMKNRKAFDKATNLGMKSDIWRYEILERYGGVYIDTDFYWLRPLDIIHHTCDFYSSAHSQARDSVNGLIGSKPNHPILKACIEEVKRSFEKKVKSHQDVIEITGPVMFTKKIAETLSGDKSLLNGTVIYPPSFFLPYPNITRYDYWNGRQTLERIITRFARPESFAVHMWATSWQKSSPSMTRRLKP